MAKNEEHWNEIFSLPVFTDSEQQPAHDRAWTWGEKLLAGGRLTQTDLIVLKGLLQACIDYRKEE
jgi:hypothetical protein